VCVWGEITYRRDRVVDVVKVRTHASYYTIHTHRRIRPGAFRNAENAPPGPGEAWGEPEGGSRDAGHQQRCPELVQHASIRGLLRAALGDERVLPGVREAVPPFAGVSATAAEPGEEDQEEHIIGAIVGRSYCSRPRRLSGSQHFREGRCHDSHLTGFLDHALVL